MNTRILRAVLARNSNVVKYDRREKFFRITCIILIAITVGMTVGVWENNYDIIPIFRIVMISLILINVFLILVNATLWQKNNKIMMTVEFKEKSVIELNRKMKEFDSYLWKKQKKHRIIVSSVLVFGSIMLLICMLFAEDSMMWRCIGLFGAVIAMLFGIIFILTWKKENSGEMQVFMTENFQLIENALDELQITNEEYNRIVLS